jgi:beta-glucosidase
MPAIITRRTLGRFFYAILAIIIPCITVHAQQPVSPDVDARVEAMLSKMTLEQKLKLMGGNGMYTFAVPEIGLHAIKMSDGPSGVRTWGPSTAYPVGLALAATWDTVIAAREGGSLAEDAKIRGVRVLLAPGVNIYRAPMNGRNFEYFGEDPYLSSRLAVGYITGLQAQGIAGTVKHFAANNSEFDRHNTNALIDERTLHEIYLPAFEAAVKEAHVSAVMDSYNMLNGQHLTQNSVLNNQILKKDWGFDGLLMSDWSATYDGVAAANGGLDLEMPKGKFMSPPTLDAAIKNGTLALSSVDDHVRRILRLAVRYGLAEKEDIQPVSGPQDRPEARKVAYDVAAESIVLLKNEKSILPLHSGEIKQIAVIGPNVMPPSIGGGGSSYTTTVSSTNLRDALVAALGNQVMVSYTPGLLTEKEICAQTVFDNGLEQESFANPGFTGDVKHSHLTTLNGWIPSFKVGGGPGSEQDLRWTAKFTAKDSGDYLILVTVHGRDAFHLYVNSKNVLDHDSTEGASPSSYSMHLDAGQRIDLRLDYVKHGNTLSAGLGVILKNKIILVDAKAMAASSDIAIVSIGMNEHYESEGFDRPWDLLPGQDDLVQSVLATNPKTIVVLNGGGGLDISRWVDRVPALLHVWYGGEEGGHALADVLTGLVNPSGKLPISLERRLENDSTFNTYYPKPGTVDVIYSEGIFVGYRLFDASTVKPLFPFGFGLSYTSFIFANLEVKDQGQGTVRVSFDVRNAGKQFGDEVAQLYVGEVAPPLPRPVKELKSFERVHLAPGQTKHLEMTLSARAFSYWDVVTHDWKRDPAKFTFYVGDSSTALPLQQTISLIP